MIPRTNISNPFIHVNCPIETKELNCSRPYCPYWHTKPPITTSSSSKSSEKRVQNDQEKMPSTSKMSGKAEKNGLEKLPIWRRPDKCRNSLTNVFEDNLFNQAHRKSRENLLDKLFGNDDNKAKTTDAEKVKKKKEKPLWEVENGREKRRRSSSGSTKERKKAAKKAKEEEDEAIRRERQALVDLLPDEGDDDEICVLDVVKSTENAGKNSSTPSSSAFQQQEITIVGETKKSIKISSATISDPDSPLPISAATTNDTNANFLHPPPSPAHSIHSTVSVVPETPIGSPTKIGDEKKSGAISSMKNKTIPSAQEQLHKRTLEAMQKVVDEQQQKTKKKEGGMNSASKYVEMEEWKPPTNKQQIPAKPKPIKKKFPTQLVIPTFSRNSSTSTTAASTASAIQMPVRVPSATKPLPTTKIPMKRESLPATPTTTTIPLKREPPATMPKTSTPKREPSAAMPKTSTPLKPEPSAAMPTTSTPIKRESVSTTTSTKLQPSLLQPKPLTVASSLKKGEQRKAHVPNFEILNTLKRQLIPLEPGNRKVSLQIRQARLAIIHAEYAKICWNQPDMAIESAQLEEKAILDKCSTRMGYLSAIPNVVKRLREAAAAAANDNDNSDGKGRKDSISHKNVLLGRHSQSVTLGLNRAQRVAEHKATHLSESDFYEALAKEYLLSPEQLWTNGYPRWVEIESVTTSTAMDEEEEGKEEAEEFEADEINPDTGYSIMEWQKKQQRRKCVEIRQSELEISKGRAQKQFVPDSELKRICARCGVEYFLTKEGNYKPGISSEDCIYHWGRAWKKRAHGVVDTRYTCCDSPISDRGCVVAGRHITQSLRMSTLAKYVETPRPFGVGDPRSKKVYALDCEMVYCVWGPEVARISMVDVLGELVLDEFVRPEHPLIDCNTKFSGLSADQINNARNNLKTAQERLFELVNSETILIGHSLESDLRALRIVHKRVVDTSVVFPHRLGPPQKRALKTLATEILQLIIQEDESGHDSKEDALVCMRIMLKKVRGGGGGTE